MDGWYVDDGCRTETSAANDYPGSYQPDSFKAGVRCCLTSEIFHFISEDYDVDIIPDRELIKVIDGYNTTCKTIGKCPGDATHSEAVEMCTEIGMTLCTKHELLTQACCSTGGDCDNHLVWTSSKETGRFIFMILPCHSKLCAIFKRFMSQKHNYNFL